MATVKKAVAKKAAAPAPVHQGVDWKSLYLYAICLITLMVCLFSVVSVINGLLNIVFPDSSYFDAASYPDKTTAALDAMRKQTEDDNQRRAVKGLLSSLSLIAVAFPLYKYHWKQTKKTD
ncbi:unannotated protein [freshwater metagenome]|uniref:Unannotated protein n=1 Tax=freshwater metagenome TaxID=449393 RepID=A0A6J7T1Z9_9ZZZZ|nr:hypothetical protein [Actinomycetota bacterium]MTB04757.1 hypothetical protein [Actinomycetota bacterium]